MSKQKIASPDATIKAQSLVIQEQEATILRLRSQLSKKRAGKRRRSLLKPAEGK